MNLIDIDTHTHTHNVNWCKHKHWYIVNELIGIVTYIYIYVYIYVSEHDYVIVLTWWIKNLTATSLNLVIQYTFLSVLSSMHILL